MATQKEKGKEKEKVVLVKYLENQDWGDEKRCFDGYSIETTSSEIKVFISNSCHCCERFGTCIMCPGNLKETKLVGAEVVSVAWGKEVDTSLVCWNDHDKEPEPGFKQERPDMACAVVDIVTDVGLVQVVAYNEHNGYYPHEVCVSWDGYSDVQQI